MSSAPSRRIRLDDVEVARLIQDGSTRWKMLALAVSLDFRMIPIPVAHPLVLHRVYQMILHFMSPFVRIQPSKHVERSERIAHM